MRHVAASLRQAFEERSGAAPRRKSVDAPRFVGSDADALGRPHRFLSVPGGLETKGTPMSGLAETLGQNGLNLTTQRRASDLRSALSRLGFLAQHEAIRWPLLGLHRLVFGLMGKNSRVAPATAEAIRRRYLGLLERDFQNTELGVYPRETLFDTPWLRYARRLPSFAADLPRYLRRARRGDFRDLPAEAHPERFPPYYRRNFHWQTDGYLSAHSANLYDLEVEILFIGCADAMRRQAIAAVLRDTPKERMAGQSWLDLGSGTGRLFALIRAAGVECELHGSDLSPWYTQHARHVLNQERGYSDIHLHVENAEGVAHQDDCFDVVSAVFLFHELPREVRRRILGEARRVLKPGGRLLVLDSAQPSESPDIASILDAFSGDLHEPFYRDYLKDDLSELVTECGFSVDRLETHFVSKLVVAHAR